MEIIKVTNSELILRQNNSIYGIIFSPLWSVLAISMISRIGIYQAMLYPFIHPFDFFTHLSNLTMKPTSGIENTIYPYILLTGVAVLFPCVGFYIFTKSGEIGTYRFSHEDKMIRLTWNRWIGRQKKQFSLHDVSAITIQPPMNMMNNRRAGVFLRTTFSEYIQLTNPYTDFESSNRSANAPYFLPSHKITEFKRQARIISEFTGIPIHPNF